MVLFIFTSSSLRGQVLRNKVQDPELSDVVVRSAAKLAGDGELAFALFASSSAQAVVAGNTLRFHLTPFMQWSSAPRTLARGRSAGRQWIATKIRMASPCALLRISRLKARPP